MSRFDVRNHPEYPATLKGIRQLRGRPLVGHFELRELQPVTQALPDLTFPINCAGELVDQLGPGKTIRVLGLSVDPVRMVKYMPAYYFPIASYENLVEKMVELVRANRRYVDGPKYAQKIREKFRGVKFPITSAAELEQAVASIPAFNIGGRTFDTKATLGELPSSFFPVRNEQDLERKALRFLQARPLIEAD